MTQAHGTVVRTTSRARLSEAGPAAGSVSGRKLRGSAVFSSVYIRKAAALPAREKLWIITVAASFAVVLVAGWAVLAPWTVRANHATKAVAALTDRTRVIALGSSHVYFTINPRLCTVPLMNLAADGCDYVFMEGVLKAHIDELPALEAVIIEVDVVPLRWDTYTAYAGDYTRVLDLDLTIGDLSVGFGRKYGLYYQKLFAYSKYFGPLCSRNKFAPRHIVDWWKGRSSGDADPVFAGHEVFEDVMTPATDGAVIVARHQRETQAITETEIEANIAALVRMVRLVRARGLRAILLRTPYHRSYWEIRPAEWNAQFEQALTRLTSEFGDDGFIYWDTEREPEFADDEFFNGDHLNAKGAARFTRLLEGWLQSVLEPGRGLASDRRAETADG